MAPMPAYRDRDPLAATDLLVIDGTNLLHALSRTPRAAPAAALVGRLRSIIPATIGIELVFDGPAEHGLRNERIAAGVRVRYAGRRTADAVILARLDDVRRDDGPEGTNALLVVTDDRDLRHAAQLRGARTAGSAWLLGRLDAPRLAAPSVGNARPATAKRRPADGTAIDPADADGDPDDDRPGWRPGRGATTKKGNPRKAPRSGRTGTMPR
jgi:predicted RNA-binding protein with PIN domain